MLNQIFLHITLIRKNIVIFYSYILVTNSKSVFVLLLNNFKMHLNKENILAIFIHKILQGQRDIYHNFNSCIHIFFHEFQMLVYHLRVCHRYVL